MNVTQTKYALDRASTIKRRRENEITKAHNDRRTLLTDKQVREELKKGNFTVKPGDGGNSRYRGSLSDYVSFKAEAKNDAIEAEQAAALAALNEQYSRLKDELMLGDVAEALALLQAFEAGA